MKSRKGRALSPYTKYEKKPHRYSEAYRNWLRAAKAGDDAGMRHYGRMHDNQFKRQV